MIVTEIESSQEDSEGCSNVEVIEIVETDNTNNETDNRNNYDIINSLNYYLEEEDINNDCCNLILEELLKPISLSDELEYEEYFLSNENNSKEFKVESFTKTLKTLVDIVTEPIVDECPSISSTGSESSDNESFSIMPMLKTLSTKFIKQTSKFFMTDTTDLIDLSLSSSEINEPDDNDELSKSDINDDYREEVTNEGNNCSDKYEMEECYVDVTEHNDEENEINNYPTMENNIQKYNNQNYDLFKNNINQDDYNKDKDEEDKKDKEKERDREEIRDNNEEQTEENENKNNREDNNENDNIIIIREEETLDKNKNKTNRDNNNEILSNKNDWNINNLAKWF